MLLPAALMFVLSACGGSKSAASQGDVAIIVPCSGPEYQSNDDYYRANAMGLSTDMTIAKQKAQSTCRTDIATAIESISYSVECVTMRPDRVRWGGTNKIVVIHTNSQRLKGP